MSDTKQDIYMALNKVLGMWATSDAATERPEMIPVYNLFSGILIGLQIGITDVHAAKLTMQWLGHDEVDAVTENVAEEIIRIVEKELV